MNVVLPYKRYSIAEVRVTSIGYRLFRVTDHAGKLNRVRILNPYTNWFHYDHGVKNSQTVCFADSCFNEYNCSLQEQILNMKNFDKQYGFITTEVDSIPEWNLRIHPLTKQGCLNETFINRVATYLKRLFNKLSYIRAIKR